MKKILLPFAFLALVLVASAQSSVAKHPVLYEAASWPTWLLNDAQPIITAPPPSATVSRTELQKVKQRVANVTEKEKGVIRYWNAGAPSYRWNQVQLQLLAQKNEVMLRTPAAWMNLAIYDATVLAWKEKVKYKRARPAATDPSIKPVTATPLTYSYPCEHTVTAAAAATVLAYFFPEKKDSIMALAREASDSRIAAGLQYPSDAEAGWKLGESVAKQIIEKAVNDGSANKYTGFINKDPKKWTGAFPMGITLSSFTPMVIKTADQFRPPAPPTFEKDMQELKDFKQNFNSKFQAYYWANTGPELWNDLVSKKMFEYGIAEDAPAAARIYTVLNIAFHDMAIAVFDAKYAYWGIRPVQLDSTYKPLITTPPFPGYPSGHAAGAATSCAVLEYFFPADAAQFHQLAQDCADSRFYAGIHFRTDNETALKMGAEMGKYIVETWMKK